MGNLLWMHFIQMLEKYPCKLGDDETRLKDPNPSLYETISIMNLLLLLFAILFPGLPDLNGAISVPSLMEKMLPDHVTQNVYFPNFFIDFIALRYFFFAHIPKKLYF